MPRLPKSPVRSGFIPKHRLGFSLVAAVLLVIVGTISFVYADGLIILYRSWVALTTPRLQFEIQPEKTTLPADGTTQIYIDARLKNSQGQLLDGSDITVTIISGQTDITKVDPPPADVSRRILLRAPDQPQIITLSFVYKHLVKNLAIDIFDPTPPTAPVIKAPANGTSFTTATPVFAGEAPINTKVAIYADANFNTALEVTAAGTFSGPLQAPLQRGKHRIHAVTINKYNIQSGVSPSLVIDVQTPDPEIDLTNLRIKPNPVPAGEAFQIFIPISSNTKAVQLVLDNQLYPLRDTNQSSVFSGVIPAPKNPGIYRLSLIITTDSGENILAEKLASIHVN